MRHDSNRRRALLDLAAGMSPVLVLFGEHKNEAASLQQSFDVFVCVRVWSGAVDQQSVWLRRDEVRRLPVEEIAGQLAALSDGEALDGG